MADFKKAWEFVKPWEIGYVDHPYDPGGPTKDGISLRWYRNAVDPKATKKDLMFLTDEDNERLVRHNWWDGKLYYAIESQDVANRYFSFVFNMGPRNATRILQRSVNNICLNTTKRLKVDGILGPKTIASVNLIFPKYLIKEIRIEASNYYKRLVEAKPKMKVFLKGWLRRANS